MQSNWSKSNGKTSCVYKEKTAKWTTAKGADKCRKLYVVVIQLVFIPAIYEYSESNWNRYIRQELTVLSKGGLGACSNDMQFQLEFTYRVSFDKGRGKTCYSKLTVHETCASVMRDNHSVN